MFVFLIEEEDELLKNSFLEVELLLNNFVVGNNILDITDLVETISRQKDKGELMCESFYERMCIPIYEMNNLGVNNGGLV